MAQEDSGIVRGVVVAVSRRGTAVKIGNEWYNYSSYHEVERANVGEQVVLVLNGRGYITKLSSVKAPAQRVPTATSHGNEYRPMTPERERTISRLSLISSAARFLAQREGNETDVVKVAMLWEAWAAGAAQLADVQEKARGMARPYQGRDERQADPDDPEEFPDEEGYGLPANAQKCSVCGALMHPAAAFEAADGTSRCPRHREGRNHAVS